MTPPQSATGGTPPERPGLRSPADMRALRLQKLRVGPKVTVLIVGGGINGAGTFRDLARQGVDCLLVDKGDWCSGTSAAPSRLIHGGLKYLETGELRLVAESTHERNRLLRNAPHLVKPLPTVVPIRSYFGGIWPGLIRLLGRPAKLRDRGLLMVEIGLTVYDWLGRKARVMPRHGVALRRASLRSLPGLDPGIVATATYYDAQVTQAERLCYEIVADGEAAHPGATALNYLSLVEVRGGIVRLRDEVSGETLEISPRVVVNAAGPWIDRVNRSAGLDKSYIGGTKGSHVLVDHPGLVQALDGRMIYFGTGDGRICLVYPFFGRALMGTTDIKADDPDGIRCEDAEVDYILSGLNELFPGLKLSADRISFRYSGIRPLPATDVGDTGQISRDHAIRTDVLPGTTTPLLSLVGGKWTTFRAFAEQASNAVLEHLGRIRTGSTAAEPIGGGRAYPATAADRQVWIDRMTARFALSPARAATLLDRYGTSTEALMDNVRPRGDTALRHLPAYSVEELCSVARSEQVVHLADLVFRRTPIAVSERLSVAAFQELATAVAPVLGWTDDQKHAQAAATIEVARRKHGIRF